MPPDAVFQARLAAAFPPVPIDSAGCFESWGTTYLDADEYAAQMSGKVWTDLDREYLIRRSDALGFLGTAHLAAVLPVYLLAMVEDGVWSAATGMLTVILARPQPGADTGLGHERFDALVEALAPEQRAAVAAALDALARQDPDGSPGQAARAALDSYWHEHGLPAANADVNQSNS